MVGCSFYTSYSLVGQIAVSITCWYESIVYGDESTVYVVVDTLALLYLTNPLCSELYMVISTSEGTLL